MSNEIAKSSGKWAQPGVPHKGWVCTGIEDREEPSEVCEMCERTEIRYVHYMEHKNYPGILACGCICAGHMEDNYIGAHQREKELKNANSRRKKWISRKWRVSVKGNSYLKTDGMIITIFKKKNAWSASINKNGKAYFSKRQYENEDLAKLAAFDALIFLKAEKI